MCQINSKILSNLNLYSDPHLNKTKDVKGFFDKNGRVRAIKLRGEPSEGFIIIPEVFLMGVDERVTSNDLDKFREYLKDKEGMEFDLFENKDINMHVCKKYVPVTQGKTDIQKGSKKVKNILLENQFRFHYDTENLRKNIHKIKPDNLITITKKYHGTSGISANVLCKKKLHWLHKFFIKCFSVSSCIWAWFVVILLWANHLFSKETVSNIFITLVFLDFFAIILSPKYRKFSLELLGNPYPEEYKDICSSRRIIKSIGEEVKNKGGYYKFDIWKHCHDLIMKNYALETGITLYYEIVGYLPNGQMIQKGYDYGCKQPTSAEWDDKGNLQYYQERREFRILVYRITYTTPEGRVIEFSWEQIKRYCEKHNLEYPKELYSGKVNHYLSQHHSHPETVLLLSTLIQEYLEQDDEECSQGIPAEGIVVRVENGRPEAYKLKSFRFLERETKALDNGEADIETEESESNEN